MFECWIDFAWKELRRFCFFKNEDQGLLDVKTLL
jgi:hypothetical protein